jgi:hypothetical protein
VRKMACFMCGQIPNPQIQAPNINRETKIQSFSCGEVDPVDGDPASAPWITVVNTCPVNTGHCGDNPYIDS